MKNLREKYGKWAVITGASSGIGEEFAKYLAKEKINLFIIARRIDKLNKIAEKLSSENEIEVIPIKADLTKEESFPAIMEEIGDREVGLLINNAGVGSIGQFQNIDCKKEIDLIKLNCIAPVLLTHLLVEKMILQKKGALIFLGSLVGMVPTPYLTTYSATKTFNIFVANALWYELKKYNIDVLALSPGSTNTEFERMTKGTGNIFIAEPSDVVKTAMKALGKKSSVVNGKRNKVLAGIVKILPIKTAVSLAGAIAKRRNSIN
ncbi:MAG: SDR family NAD(P)-dependent oxidoreductase [Ignavibacteriales bacterium]|nr:SDR family NAD(P)-dependent oxidoreductase [Ignavibacteriales bacterium]